MVSQNTVQRQASSMRFIPIEKCCTSYAHLRRGKRLLSEIDDVAVLPIRVVPKDDGAFEVIDGFKRLAAWREQQYTSVPVVIESFCSKEEQKRRMLLANAPRRTVTALDEGKIICSMIDDDGKTAGDIMRLLGKKKSWVARRIDIGRYLSSTAEEKMSCGAMGPSVGHALCALSHKEQDQILVAIDQHGLRAHEALDLISAFRVADEKEQKIVLRDPKGQLNQKQAPTLSPCAMQLENKLEDIRQALHDLSDFIIPEEMAPPEKRRIEAIYRSVLSEVKHMAHALTPERRAKPMEQDYHGHDNRQEERNIHNTDGNETAQRPGEAPPPNEENRTYSQGNTRGDCRLAQEGIRHPENPRPLEPLTEKNHHDSYRGGMPIGLCSAESKTEHARTLSPDHFRESEQGSHDIQNTARDQGTRISREAHDSRRICT